MKNKNTSNTFEVTAYLNYFKDQQNKYIMCLLAVTTTSVKSTEKLFPGGADIFRWLNKLVPVQQKDNFESKKYSKK